MRPASVVAVAAALAASSPAVLAADAATDVLQLTKDSFASTVDPEVRRWP